LLQADRRITTIGFIDDLLKLIVSHDVQAIHCGDAGALTVGQTQTTTNRLLDQCARIRRTQRHNGVEIGHVPAFLQHVDVNHDLGRLVYAFNRQQAADHFFLFRAGAAGIHLDHFALVASAVEFF
jgi:hypothetical protein